MADSFYLLIYLYPTTTSTSPSTTTTTRRKAGAVRKLIYGMNLTLDGYIASAGDDIGWGGPRDEL
ncbi:MAG: hypothetical protein AABW88_00130, partial [Nanoarchaeota archaeon]